MHSRAFLLAILVSYLVWRLDAAPQLDVIETARRNGLFSFVYSVDEAGFTKAVKSLRNVTVFAPTDAAFRNLPDAVRNALANNRTFYQDILKYHIVKGGYKAADLHDEGIHPTVYEGYLAKFNVYNHSNMNNIYTYEGSVVSRVDIEARNGIIHVIDQVVTSVLPRDKNLLDVIAKRKDLTFLASLAPLAPSIVNQILRNVSAPFTVFTPNDEAFGKLRQDIKDKLKNDTVFLQKILEYHIAPQGTYFSAGLVNNEQIPTYNATSKTTNFGNTIKFTVVDGKAKANQANIVEVNVQAQNGILHVIDTVLQPPGLE